MFLKTQKVWENVQKQKPYGILVMKILKGKLYRDTEVFGEMDPYVNIEHFLSGKKFKTEVKHDGGKNPVWDQTFEIEIYSLEDELKIKCFDEDMGQDDIIGETTITVHDLISLGDDDCVTLYHE